MPVALPCNMFLLFPNYCIIISVIDYSTKTIVVMRRAFISGTYYIFGSILDIDESGLLEK